MTRRLDGRVAVVTGGARGIGAAIAEGLADAGATVVIGDVSPVVSGAGRPEHRNLDVASPASVDRFVGGVAADHGHLDIVVNNAGIMFEEPVEGHSLESWERALAVNLTGPFLMARAAVDHLRASAEAGRAPAIVNIGSIEGFACNPDHAAYAATKAGVHGLTNSLAVDLGPMGVRVNAIAPGWIDTELNASYVAEHPDRDEVVRQLAALHPLGHIGRPSDIGDVAVWLAGPESRFVTGQVIAVEGGRLARPPLPPIMGR